MLWLRPGFSLYALLPCPNQCTLTDPGHGGDLFIGFPLLQKHQAKLELFRGELSGAAILEAGVLPGH